MKHKVIFRGYDESIEEEILLEVNGCSFRGFVTDGDNHSFQLGDEIEVELGLVILDDLDMKEADKDQPLIECVNDSFAHYIRGILDADTKNLQSCIPFKLDEEDMYDYNYLDGKFVEMKADRIAVRY